MLTALCHAGTHVHSHGEGMALAVALIFGAVLYFVVSRKAVR